MTDETPVVGTELDANWKNVVPVWWLVIWHAAALFYGGAVILEVSWELIVTSEVWDYPNGLNAIWGSLVMIWVVRSALRKRYKTFRIALIEATTSIKAPSGAEFEVAWKHVCSVWWFVLWRSAVVFYVTGITLWFTLRGLPGVNTGEVMRVGGQVISAIALVWIVRSALRNQYKTFRIALVPHPTVVS